VKTLFRKGKALARLHKFQNALKIFEHIKAKEEIDTLGLIENMVSGDIDEFVKDPKTYFDKNLF